MSTCKVSKEELGSYDYLYMCSSQAALVDVQASKDTAKHVADSSHQLGHLLPVVTNSAATTSTPAISSMLQQAQGMPRRLDDLADSLEERLGRLRRSQELWKVVKEKEEMLNAWLGVSRTHLQEVPGEMDDSDGDGVKRKLQKIKVRIFRLMSV